MRKIYSTLLCMLLATEGLAHSKAMLHSLMAAGGACYELDSTWTPKWANIVSYWKLNGSGAIANSDSVPATVGTSGVASNANGSGMAYVTTKFNQGVQFDGTDDRICMTNDANLAFGTGDFTVGFWLKTSNKSSYQNIFARDDASNGNGLDFLTNTTTGVFRTWVGGTALNGATDITTGKWVYALITRSSGTIYQYVNGKLDASASAAGSIVASSSVCLGRYIGGNYPLNGLLDEVAVWNAALTAAEIKLIYDQQSCGMN